MILPEELKESARSMRFRENTPLHSGIKVITLKDGKPITLIDVRFYASRSGVIYCAVWVIDHRKGSLHGRGVGVARGYGYHMTSAALSSAIHDMGIKLEDDDRCSCIGDDAMDHTLEVLGKQLGYDDVYLIKFYR